jgi:hypothetical protein
MQVVRIKVLYLRFCTFFFEKKGIEVLHLLQVFVQDENRVGQR